MPQLHTYKVELETDGETVSTHVEAEDAASAEQIARDTHPWYYTLTRVTEVNPDQRPANGYFFYYEKDVPDIVFHKGDIGPDYYEAGRWSFNEEEDGDLEDARQALLSWLAWYRYLDEKRRAE